MTSIMSVAYVLISVKPGTARDVYSKLENLRSIQQVDAVTGPYDFKATCNINASELLFLLCY